MPRPFGPHASMNALLKNLLALVMTSVLMLPLLGQAQARGSQEVAAQGARVLVVVTNHADYPSRQDKTGLWLTELRHFWDVLQVAGVAMDIVSPKSGNSPLLPRQRSTDSTSARGWQAAHQWSTRHGLLRFRRALVGHPGLIPVLSAGRHGGR